MIEPLVYVKRDNTVMYIISKVSWKNIDGVWSVGDSLLSLEILSRTSSPGEIDHDTYFNFTIFIHTIFIVTEQCD